MDGIHPRSPALPLESNDDLIDEYEDEQEGEEYIFNANANANANANPNDAMIHRIQSISGQNSRIPVCIVIH